ncbi:MAG: hypothetical protein HZA54_03970 [Planctomycetes bacterium]|nr:hypothetical protein [Planctomycetota bacterium]
MRRTDAAPVLDVVAVRPAGADPRVRPGSAPVATLPTAIAGDDPSRIPAHCFLPADLVILGIDSPGHGGDVAPAGRPVIAGMAFQEYL